MLFPSWVSRVGCWAQSYSSDEGNGNNSEYERLFVASEIQDLREWEPATLRESLIPADRRQEEEKDREKQAQKIEDDEDDYDEEESDDDTRDGFESLCL